MSNSSNVNAGDQILATQYNNLRLDVLDQTTGHDHDGTDGRDRLLPASMTITPTGAIDAVNINQDYDDNGLYIDSDATTLGKDAIYILAKFGVYVQQDISNGRGMRIIRNIAEAGIYPLAYFGEANAASTQPVLEIANAGSGEDIKTPSFTLTNGVIVASGGGSASWNAKKTKRFTLPFVWGELGATNTIYGITIDAANERCSVSFALPDDCTQIDVLRVFGESLANTGVGNGMAIELELYAGANNESYNTHTATLTNKISIGFNYSIGDIILWEVSYATMGGFQSATAGDIVTIILEWNASFGTDISTNAYMKGIEIEYQ